MSSPTSSSSLLLCILVKSANIEIVENTVECYSYVVLKIGNVKSTTSVLNGSQPRWEEEFFFDVPDRSTGLQIELWQRGQFRDQIFGLCHIRFNENEDDEHLTNQINERWIILDSEVVLDRQGQFSRTCYPTKHSLFISTSIELPFDLTDEESRELTNKLQLLHHLLDKEGRQLQDVTFDELNSYSSMYLDQQPSVEYQQVSHHSHSQFSDDSDYTSDISYPINTQANFNYPVSSMSQSTERTPPTEIHSLTSSTRKPLAFVQPVIRDLSNDSSRRLIGNPMQKPVTITQPEPLSYVSQPRKLPSTKTTDCNPAQKSREL